ncbi:P-loop containing nucleoside triphosphate hydrolase protein, partial [Trichophaea hybrida]
PVFAVMGETGAGKSAFIKALGGRDFQFREEPKVGDDVYSCMKNITWYIANLNGEDIHIIDTPCFNDNSLSDADILKMLVDSLAAMYRSHKHLNGLLYIHDITEVRMKASEIKNLNLFQKLCGEQSFGNIVLVTNKW